MSKRLILALNIMKPYAPIFISIDDNEVANLKLLCNEIFGEHNFLACLPTIMNLKGNQDQAGFAGTHEYTLVYCKDKNLTKILEFDIDDEELYEWQIDDIGYFKKGANLKSTGINAPREKRPFLFYPILIHKDTLEVTSINSEEYKKIYSKETKTFNDSHISYLKNKYEQSGYNFILPITNNESMTWRWQREKVLNEPYKTLMKMSGNKILAHMRQNPDNLKEGLDVITETTVNFVKELVNIGVDGIFFASQLGNYDMMSIKEYEEFGRPYDLQILDVVKDKMWFNIMHMHGNAPMFELMEKYPVQALNWHDRLVDISLKDGRSMSDKLLIGGVDEYKVLNDANEEELLAHFKDALEQVEDQKVILGPGCCVPLYVNEDRFEIAKRLIEKL